MKGTPNYDCRLRRSLSHAVTHGKRSERSFDVCSKLGFPATTCADETKEVSAFVTLAPTGIVAGVGAGSIPDADASAGTVPGSDPSPGAGADAGEGVNGSVGVGLGVSAGAGPVSEPGSDPCAGTGAGTLAVSGADDFLDGSLTPRRERKAPMTPTAQMMAKATSGYAS